jgi:hypothetical protein
VRIEVSGLPTSDESLFVGKKRTFHIAAQGRFKRPIR